MLLSLLLLSYSIYDITKKDDAIKKRIETLNDFVFSIEEDLSRQVYASGYRIIFIFQKNIIDTGDYIDDVDSRFEEAFYNGTLYDENQSLMEGVIFSDIKEALEKNGEKINAEVNFTNSSVSISHKKPWEVKVTLKGRLIIKDKANLASWNRTQEVNAYIPIDTFEDPVYIVSTNGFITNRFIKTPYNNFVQGSDVSNLSNHLENSYYTENDNSPTFLDRLEGNLSAESEEGIESLVYLPELSNAGISVKSKSCVDYIYFSDENPEAYKISGMQDWFKIDNQSNRHEVYNVSHIII